MPIPSTSMAHRLIRTLACGLFLAVNGAGAQDAAAERERRLEEAKRLQKQGADLKDEAKQVFEARKAECFKKFRVTGCQSEAKQQYIQATNEARRIENEGNAMERQVKKEELAEKDARRAAEAPQREADLRTRQEETQAERERDAARRAERLADKEEEARAGAERQAAGEERLRKKQEQHARKVAEKMEKARRRQAEAEQ